MDRSKFYGSLRARSSGVFGTSLSQSQVNGMEAILDEAERRGVPAKQLAYILATAYHETARTMQPIEEYGKGKGRPYAKPTGPYSQSYYGRGFVQLTWLANYEKAGKLLGVDLVRYPAKALDLDIATEIIIQGMLDGWFTGKKLSDYISGDKADYAGARKIVNGTDRASQIAGYAKAFEAALAAAGYFGKLATQPTQDAPEPVPATPEPPAPQPAPAAPAEPSTPAASYVERNPFWRVLFAILRKIFRVKKG